SVWIARPSPQKGFPLPYLETYRGDVRSPIPVLLMLNVLAAMGIACVVVLIIRARAARRAKAPPFDWRTAPPSWQRVAGPGLEWLMAGVAFSAVAGAVLGFAVGTALVGGAFYLSGLGTGWALVPGIAAGLPAAAGGLCLGTYVPIRVWRGAQPRR